MKKVLGLWLLCACAVSCCVNHTAVNRAEAIAAEIHNPTSKYVLVACHRGDWRNWPENSIPAIESVISMGADIVEIDIHMTADSVLVLCHDSDVRRTTNFRKVFRDDPGKSAKVCDLTLAEIKSLSLNRMHQAAVIDTLRMPTLREALECTRGRICVNIDKGYDYYDMVLALTEELGVTGQVLIKGKKPIEVVKADMEAHPHNMMYMPIVDIQKEKGKPARVTKAKKSSLKDIREFSGTIEGMQQTNAISKMGDPLEKIYVQVGSTVKKDQVLAEYIFTGDNTQYQQVQEQVALLEKSTQRLREVHAKGGLSQQDLDQAEMQLKIAKMNLETARRATKILAPAAGVVTELNFQEGQTPGVGATLCTIANLDKVILKLNVTSKDIALFKNGAAATVEVAGKKMKGKVTLIPLAANPVTRFFPVEVTFDNSSKKLLPGMYMTAEIETKQVNGVVVPAEAVIYKNGLNMVWTVDKEGNARRKIVKVGIQTKDQVQIAEGLKGGETVMVEGMSKMNDGDKVNIVK